MLIGAAILFILFILKRDFQMYFRLLEIVWVGQFANQSLNIILTLYEAFLRTFVIEKAFMCIVNIILRHKLFQDIKFVVREVLIG